MRSDASMLVVSLLLLVTGSHGFAASGPRRMMTPSLAHAAARSPLPPSLALSPNDVTAATVLLADSSAIPSALAAYGHYTGLVLSTLCLATERLTIKPGMSPEDEDLVAAADAIYGLAGLLVVYTGYLRVTAYGKGWEFYQHEPIFWVKLTLVSIMGAASFFPRRRSSSAPSRSVRRVRSRR